MAQPRLTSAMLASALIRRTQAEGGFATVVRHGDDVAGAILVECQDRGVPHLLLERATDLDGHQSWRPVAQALTEDRETYQQRLDKRIRSDPDLWIIELNTAQAQRFTDEILNID